MRSHITLVVVLLSSLLLSACGGGSSSGRSSGVTVPTPAPPPANDPPPSEPPPDDPKPPLDIVVIAPDAEFELACSNTTMPEDTAAPASGDTTGANTGVLVDSAVSGVAYHTPTIQGITDVAGTFHFQDGETVRFTLGDLHLGQVDGLAQVSPFDLAGSTIPTGMPAITRALQQEDHPFQAVINTAVLLQSLDGDGDPGNGIAIAPEVAALFNGSSLDTRQPVQAFETAYWLSQALTAANNRGLFSVPHGAVYPARALAHLYATLGVEAHTFGLALEESDWDGDGIPNDTRRYQYDTDGNLVLAESYEDGGWQQGIETWTYDANGRLVASEMREVGEQSSETSLYSPTGALTKRTSDHDDNGIIDSTQTWSYQYNPQGSLSKATLLNRQEQEDEASTAVAIFQYSSAGNPTRIEITGESLHLAAAQLGLPVVLYLEYGTRYLISYDYDADGTLVADTLDASNPELGYHIVNRSFDSRGNITRSEGRFLQYGTDNDEQVTVTGYRYEYNSDGLAARKSIDREGDGTIDQIEEYSYDQHGALVRIGQDNNADGEVDYIENRPYVYAYDANDRISRRTLDADDDGDPEEVISYSYHQNGALAQSDTWIREVRVTQVTTWQYNTIGKLLREQRGYGYYEKATEETVYGYDNCGGLISRQDYGEDGSRHSLQHWQYDTAGKLRYHEWQGIPAIPTITDSVLADGLPIFASDGFERWQYDAEGRPSRYQFECEGECVILTDIWGDGLVALPDQLINWEYDDDGRVTRELVDENSDGEANRATAYAYDEQGRVIREQVNTTDRAIPDQIVLYHYDDNDRLLRREVDMYNDGAIDSVEATEYNAYGNVVSRFTDENNDGVAEEMIRFFHYYDDQGNHIRQEDDRDDDGVIDRIQKWTYDTSGNVLSHGYDDDVDGILEQVESFEYDTRGNLLRQSTGYSFDGDAILEETESRKYVPTGWGHLFNSVLE